MSLLDNLNKIKELLSDESKWIQHFYAKRNDNTHVDALSLEACCWCLLGAIRKVTERDEDEEHNVMDYLRQYIGDYDNVGYLSADCIVNYNDADNTDFHNVSDLLDTAIEKASAKS